MRQPSPLPQSPVLREVLRSRVKDVLMERIVEGTYPPGARLVEMQIARELNVSQGPVREALRDLESVGVIETRAFHGARVRNPGVAELLEAFPVRAALEALAAAEATARITEHELDELERLIERMEIAAAQPDAHAQSVANGQFHALIVEVAGNAILKRQWALLEPFARTYLTAAHAGIDLLRLAQRHRKILEPMRRRDLEGAAAAMRTHLLEAATWLKETNPQ